MDCASCVAHVERATPRRAGRRVGPGEPRPRPGGRAVRPARTTPDAIAAAVTDAGYPSAPESPGIAAGNVEEERLQRQTPRGADRGSAGRSSGLSCGSRSRRPTGCSTCFVGGPRTCTSPAVDWMGWLSLVTSTIAIVYVGGGVLPQRLDGASPPHEQHGHAHRDGRDRGLRLQPRRASSATSLGWWRDAAGPVLHGVDRPARADQPRPLARSPRPPAAGSAIRELLDLAPATAHAC